MQRPHLETNDYQTILSCHGQSGGETESTFGDLQRTVEIEPSDCVGYISRGNARYHKSHPECEADYRAGFILDAVLAASEIVRRLEADIRHDVLQVLVTCRMRLRIDTRISLPGFDSA